MNNFMGRDNDNFMGGGRGGPFRHEGPNMFPRGGRGSRSWRSRGGNPRFPSFGRNGKFHFVNVPNRINWQVVFDFRR